MEGNGEEGEGGALKGRHQNNNPSPNKQEHEVVTYHPGHLPCRG